MTHEEQIDLATELWAISQAPTGEIGIDGVTQLMIPVIAAYTSAVEAKERERCAKHLEEHISYSDAYTSEDLIIEITLCTAVAQLRSLK